MRQKIEEGRNSNLVGLLKFLNNPFSYNHELNIYSKLILPSKYALKAVAKKYFTRLYIEGASITSANVGKFDESHDNESGIFSISQPVAPTLLNKSSLTLEQKLDANICNVKPVKTEALENLANLKNLTKEINIFEATGKRKKSKQYVLSINDIKPTSIESERAFSAVGLFMGKMF